MKATYWKRFARLAAGAFVALGMSTAAYGQESLEARLERLEKQNEEIRKNAELLQKQNETLLKLLVPVILSVMDLPNFPFSARGWNEMESFSTLVTLPSATESCGGSAAKPSQATANRVTSDRTALHFMVVSFWDA